MTFNPKTSLKRMLPAIAVALAAMVALAVVNRAHLKALLSNVPLIKQALNKQTVEDQILTYGAAARVRLRKMFEHTGVDYPPERIAFVAIKDTRKLQVYAANKVGDFALVHTYEILGASGTLGPKLREGDLQVPEGIYRIDSLEPNTPYHLGLRVNYPNDFDLQKAAEDARTNPGSDILIHGSTGSIGCLAMGDEASEDLFVLAHDVRNQSIPLVLSPVDLRTESFPPSKTNDPPWLHDLYARIQQTLSSYPAPNES